jgi:beta-lactam-binding protein with PASTA domain
MRQIDGPQEIQGGGALVPAPLTTVTAISAFRAPLLDLDVLPSLVAGRRARYTAAIVNRSGHEVQARLSVTPADPSLRGIVAPSTLVLGPGQAAHAVVQLRPRRPQLVRRDRQRTARVRIHAPDGSVVAARKVIFVQQRLLPPWVGLLVLALLAAAAFAATRMPERATVPNVEGASDVATADLILRGAGLRLDPRLRSRTTAGVTPGTILDQIPAAGVRARGGDRVSLLVAVSSKRTVTPALDGQTPGRAAAILRASGLVAGPVLPEGAAPTAVVASQLPAAGSRVPAGTAVTTFVNAYKSGAAAGGVAPDAAAGSGGGKPVAVPAIDGRHVTEYARAVAAAGLVPHVERTVDPRPAGTLVGVRPAPGQHVAEGGAVRILVAAGVPQLAYDSGDVLRVFDPRAGRTVKEASPPTGKAVEPSWSPDGRRLLYRVGRRLLLVSARLSDRGRVVYEGKTKYASATFAPAPADGLVALVRRTHDDGDLCFGRIGERALRPRCIADQRWDLGRQISWRPGGRELLVFGVLRSDPGHFGILRYRSSTAFSGDPHSWHGELVTDTSVLGRGAISAAYSPSGSQVAVVANFGLRRFQVFVTGAFALRYFDAPALPVRGCEVAWRPDGHELAVVQSDDECGRPVGQIVRVNPARPRQTITVSNGGRHPGYQPLTYAGPKGVS